MGTVKLGDDFWGSYDNGPVGANLHIDVERSTEKVSLIGQDQIGYPRPLDGAGDSGAIESQE
jgi:hypothetical protein